jgi:hypothetical protein
MFPQLSLPFSSLLQQNVTNPSYTSLLPQSKLRSVFEKALGGQAALQDILDGKTRYVGGLPGISLTLLPE